MDFRREFELREIGQIAYHLANKGDINKVEDSLRFLKMNEVKKPEISIVMEVYCDEYAWDANDPTGGEMMKVELGLK